MPQNCGCDPSGLIVNNLRGGDQLYFMSAPHHDKSGPTSQLPLEAVGNEIRWDPNITYNLQSLATYQNTNSATSTPNLVDPTGSPSYQFDESTDFRLSGQPQIPWVAMFQGTVQLASIAVKSTTSDDTTLTIQKVAGSSVAQPGAKPQPFAATTICTMTLLASDTGSHSMCNGMTVNVDIGDELFFSIGADTPIDPSRVTWLPQVSYTCVERGTMTSCGAVTCTSNAPSVCTLAGDPDKDGTIAAGVLTQAPTVFYNLPALFPRDPPQAFVAPPGGPTPVNLTGSASAALYSTPGAQATVLVQGVNTLYCKQTITCTNGDMSSDPQCVATLGQGQMCAGPIILQPGDEIMLTVYAPHNFDGTFLPGEGNDSSLGMFQVNGGPQICANVWSHDGAYDDAAGAFPVEAMQSGGSHGWFFGFYNGDSLPFDKSQITFPFETDPTFNFGTPMENFLGLLPPGPGLQPYDPQEWAGPGAAFIAPGTQNPTRAGFASAGDAAGVVPSLRHASTWDLDFGGGAFGGGAAYSQGRTSTDRDFFDFNGDRCADSLTSDGTVQLGDCTGNFAYQVTAANVPSPLRLVNHNTAAANFGNGALVNVVSGSGDEEKQITAGFQVGLNYGQSTTQADWSDVNGDGLPDAVSRDPSSSNFIVHLNYGYRLGSAVSWAAGAWDKVNVGASSGNAAGLSGLLGKITGNVIGATAVRTQDSASQSASVGVQGQGGDVSGGAAVGYVYNVTRTLVDLVDINGDGLPDEVMRIPGEQGGGSGALHVRLNLGESFDSNEVLWSLPLWEQAEDGSDGDASNYAFLDTIDDALEYRRSQTFNASVNVQVCYVLCVGVLGSYSSGSGWAHTTLEDVDGDGLPDQVFKQRNDPTVYAKLNQVGATNLLTTVHRPLGGTRNVLSEVDPREYTLTYVYDTIAQTYRMSTTDSFGYSSASSPNYFYGTVQSVTDENGQPSLYNYDPFGRLSTVFGPNDIGATEPTIAFSYSESGTPAGTTPPTQPFPAYATTSHKDVQHPGDPIVTSTFSDGLDRIIQTKKDLAEDSPSGPVTGMTVSGAIVFDARGRIQQQGQPVFDTGGPSAFVTVPMTNATTYSYDILDRKLSVTRPDGALTTVAYGFDELDGYLRLSSTIKDPNVNAVGATLPGFARESFLDVHGPVLGVKEMNRLGGTTGVTPTTLITRYEYDPLEELVLVTDANGNQTSAQYDSVGRMFGLTSLDAGHTEWRYDLSGNLGAKQTANLAAANQTIQYQYDFNRLKAIVYPTSPAVKYAYGAPSEAGAGFSNVAGRIKEETSEAGITDYQYDNLGNVSHLSWVLNSLQPPVQPFQSQISYSYDSFQRRLKTTFPDGEVVSYGYDAGGNVTSVIGVNTNASSPGTTLYVTQVGYDQFEERTRLVYGNGIQTTYTYDPPTRRLTNVNASELDPGLILAGKPARPFQALNYAYDPVGNIKQIRNDAPFDDTMQGFVLVGTSTQNFTYDDLYQLKTAEGAYQENTYWRYAYGLGFTYDGIGNIQTKAQTNDEQVPNPAAPGTWIEDYPIEASTYSANYKYGGQRPHAPTEVDETVAQQPWQRVLAYDADGNQSGWTYQVVQTRKVNWDEEDRIRSVDLNGVQLAAALYNGAGERTDNLQSGGTAYYETAYFGADQTLRDGAFLTKQIFLGDTRIASKMNADWFGPAPPTIYFHDDQLGSTNFLSNDEQELVSHEEYFPSGELWVDETDSRYATVKPYLFNGKELDTATGLYYFGARYYDPHLSVWASADPALPRFMMGRNAGPRRLGLYTYAFNNSIALIDPTGRDPSDPWWKRFALEASGVAVGVVEGVLPAVQYPSSPDSDVEFGRGLGLVSGGMIDVGAGGGMIGGAGVCTVGTAGACALGPAEVVAAGGLVVAANGAASIVRGQQVMQMAARKRSSGSPSEPPKEPPTVQEPKAETSPAPKEEPGGERMVSPQEKAEQDHAALRDRVRQETSGYESGRHNEYPRKMARELRNAADAADKRGDLPEYGKRLREIAETYDKRAREGHPGGKR